MSRRLHTKRKRSGKSPEKIHTAVQQLTFIFLYCSVSTLKPMVGIVWTASSLSFWSRYRIVVLPALSKPRIRIRTSLEPKRVSKILLNMIPILERYSRSLQGSQHTSQSHLHLSQVFQVIVSRDSQEDS